MIFISESGHVVFEFSFTLKTSTKVKLCANAPRTCALLYCMCKVLATSADHGLLLTAEQS